MWAMRKDRSGWNNNQLNTMYRLQRSNLKSARAWRLKEALRTTYAQCVSNNNEQQTTAVMQSWVSCARRCRLEPFKKHLPTNPLRPAIQRNEGVTRYRSGRQVPLKMA
jgi:transposase